VLFRSLARAINLNVVLSQSVPLKKIKPATLFGKGKVSEIGDLIHANDIGLAIIDHAISPVQQQNLETAWNCKVLDRTALILEIFGERAQTKEGRLQVELAHLNYQKGRLVRSWTHLERQRGGLGFVGGPGETQIEADRRMIAERINRLEKELEKVRRTRSLHRAKRKKVPHPVVALVGYTNAGKSTLFNKLTGANVLVKDQLFATLDPTMRQLDLPMGTKVILSDTVGFVSNLPTHLVAAFRATLEEVLEADLIIHVRDIADADSAAQAYDVLSILDQLGLDAERQSRIIEVLNKIDLLDPDALAAIKSTRSDKSHDDTRAIVTDPVLVSSLTGEGMEDLRQIIESLISSSDNVVDIHLPLDKLSRLGWIYENANIVLRTDNEDGSVSMTVRGMPDVLRALKE